MVEVRSTFLFVEHCGIFGLLWVFFFFFKQKTAYEIMPSLVGSEMCIRDSAWRPPLHCDVGHTRCEFPAACLLYTSDAADDLLCVDLGGRRIIKKKKKK